jgi:hypothetical protein
MALRTRLGELLRPLNAEYGKVTRLGNNSNYGCSDGFILSIFTNYSTNL